MVGRGQGHLSAQRSPPPLAFAYQAAWWLGAPLIRWEVARRLGRGDVDVERIGERFGRAAQPRPAGPLLWLHASSRGEAVAARALAVGLREVGYAGTVLVTTFTVRGAPVVHGLPGVIHQYPPIDDRRCVARFLDHWSPDAAIVLVADVWPNVVWECGRRGVSLAACSAQLSAASVRRWRPVSGSADGLFTRFGLVLATDDEQAARWASLGATSPEPVGCLKAAAEPLEIDEELRSALVEAAAGRPVVLLASTHAGEEAVLLEALPRVCRDALVVVAPRHPDRGAEVAALAAAAGLSAGRRSLGERPEAGARLWVADRLGEMGALLAAADVVVLGGSFVPVGGHNPVEPAQAGRPVVTGPDCSNNRATTEALQEAGALLRVRDGAGAAAAVEELLADAERRHRMGEAAKALAGSWTERRRVAARRVLAAAGC